MAIGLRRKVRLDSRREQQKITRRRNAVSKRKERTRRDARLLAKFRENPAGPHAPEVKSWLSQRIGKSYGKITSADLQPLLA